MIEWLINKAKKVFRFTAEKGNRPMDLDNEANIVTFIDAFYIKVLQDPLLKPIFFEGANIDVNAHKLMVYEYWQKLLLGQKKYNRHTMNIHRAVHKKYAFTNAAFERWLTLFIATARKQFDGPYCEKAIRIATTIAANMENSLLH